MKNMMLLLACLVIFSACKKEDKLTYSSPENIYFDYLLSDGSPDTTSLSYSFAYNVGIDRDTVWLPVKISGKRVSYDRKFNLMVVDSLTTAQEGLHFESLKDSYLMPADSGKIRVPIILKNTDPALANQTLKLTLFLAADQDFLTALPAASLLKTINFSNRLEEPYWWKYWQGELRAYNRTKHQLFLISSGTIDLVDMSKPEAYLEIPRTLYYIANTRYLLNFPFQWVAENPEKGFVLQERSDGSGDYDFFSINAPDTKFHLKFFPQAGAYIFIDENGNQIVI